MSDVSATPVSSPAPVTSAPANVSESVSDTPAVASTDNPSLSAESPDKGREEVNFSARFAALTRREKELVNKQRQKDQENAEKLKALEDPDFVTWRSAKEERNVLKALKALGFNSLHEAAEFIVSDGKKTPEQEIAEIRKQLADKEQADKDLAEKNKKEYIEGVFSEVQRQIDTHIAETGDTYELIRLNGANEEVLALIEEHFTANDGEVLSIADACQMVEKYYEDEAKKFLSAKKFAPKIETPKPDEALQSGESEPKTVQGSKTLTNASVIAAPSKPQTYLSDDESKAAAAEFLRKALETQKRG